MFLIASAYAQQATPAQQPQGGGGLFLFMLIAMFLMMYFLSIRPQNKRRKEMMEMQAGLKKGDEIILSSGIMGRVFAVGDLAIDVEIAKSVVIRTQKAYVMQVLPKGSLKEELKMNKTVEEIENKADSKEKNKEEPEKNTADNVEKQPQEVQKSAGEDKKSAIAAVVGNLFNKLNAKEEEINKKSEEENKNTTEVKEAQTADTSLEAQAVEDKTEETKEEASTETSANSEAVSINASAKKRGHNGHKKKKS